jgi:hypothetical protein
MGSKGQVGYPSDVTDEEWGFVLPYLLLCREDSPQRHHDLRAVFNAVRYVARSPRLEVVKHPTAKRLRPAAPQLGRRTSLDRTLPTLRHYERLDTALRGFTLMLGNLVNTLQKSS